MVNTGGRSKGCSTCRQRRVKCDEQRPVSNRCQRCGLQCNGAKETTFINIGSQAAKFPPSTNKKGPIDNVDQKASLPLSLGTRAFEIEVYIMYTKMYLLRDGPINSALQNIQLCDMYAAAENPTDAHLLHLSILNLCINFFGVGHGKCPTGDKAYVIHGRTLKFLTAALSDPYCYNRDDVLLSVVAMILLEGFVPTGRKYYLKHMMGLERLLELRGPTALYPLGSFKIYKVLRQMILFASIDARTGSILVSESWKAIPWSENSDRISEDDIFNTLADCTVLMAEYDSVNEEGESDSRDMAQARTYVGEDGIRLLECLTAWKRRWANEWQCHLVNAHGLFGKASTPFNPESLTFTNHSAAIMLVMYNTALINVLEILTSLPLDMSQDYLAQLLVGQEVRLNDCESDCEAFARVRYAAALEICACLYYIISEKPNMDASSLMASLLAVKTAWKTLGGNNTEEGRWITTLVEPKDTEVVARGLWVNS